MNYYIHVPFCRSKCGYCAFYSEPAPASDTVAAYFDKLERELATASTLPPAETVYIGGGTPTLPDIETLRRFFGCLKEAIPCEPDCEITIEANPETLDAAKVELLRSFATRLSLGVQSFDPEKRRLLGRNCGQSALKKALELIKAANFPHWNCDLIYAIPGQTLDDWRQELKTALELGVDHLSCYNLTPEEGAKLGSTFAIDDDTAADMYLAAGTFLKSGGLPRYEISNYARPGAECRHNVNVWRGGLLRGFGPSAAGFDGTDRVTAASPLPIWLAGASPESDPLPRAERLNEIFAVNLRTVAGWTPELWAKVPHADDWKQRLKTVLTAFKTLPPDWIETDARHLRLTADGLLFWDSVAQTLI